MKDVFYSPDTLKQDDLLKMVDTVKENRSDEDLLFQVLVDYGMDLSSSIHQKAIMDKAVFFVDENELIACFDKEITEELVKKLAARKPLRIVLRDSHFTSDAAKINTEQIIHQFSPDTNVRVI